MRMNARREAEGNVTENLCRHVGQRLKARRKALNISQARMAEMMQLSYQQIQKYESGHSQIFLGRLLQFAHILNVAPEYFYQGAEFYSIGSGIECDAIPQVRARPVDILLVGHNPVDVQQFERALHPFRDSITFYAEADPAKAMKIIRHPAALGRGGAPDLVILDVAMPRDGGMQMLKDLKANSQTAPIPVIILTSNASRKGMTEAYRMNAAGFIPKSADPDAFREAVRGCLHYWVKTVVLP